MATTVKSSTAQFGRRWNLTIQSEANAAGDTRAWSIGQDAWLPESLRVTFEVTQMAYKAFWWADINIYNLNSVTQAQIIKAGSTVTLSAGYQDGSNYGVIFKGTIFQCTWTREAVVDQKLTLHCLTGISQLANNMVSFQAAAGISQRNLVLRMMEQANTPITAAHIDSDTLGQKVLPRGKIVFGSPQKYLSEIAQANGMQFFYGNDGVYLGFIANENASASYTYASVPNPSSTISRKASVNYTIIDTPRQVPEGVVMRVLLDARLIVKAPALYVEISDTVIQQMLAMPSSDTTSSNLYPILSTNGIYAVGAVRHTGDTRGNEWYSDVTCLTNKGNILLMMAKTNSVADAK